MILARAAGTLLAVAGLAAGLVAALLLAPLPLAVTVDLRGSSVPATGAPVRIGEVAGRVALLVPAALVAVGLPLLSWSRDSRVVRLLPVGAAAPIVLFLLAQLNGVRDVGALVLTWAATAAAVLMRSVPGRAPWSIAAMLGIVPWGVIGLHQVGALLTGGDVPAGVRLLTVAVLAACVAEFLRGRRDPFVPRPAPLLVALPPALLAAGSLLL